MYVVLFLHGLLWLARFVIHIVHISYMSIGAVDTHYSFCCLFLFVFSCADDCIGIAVDLWSEVTVARSDKFEITAEGEGAEEMPKDDTNYMVVGCKAAFDAAGKPVPLLKYHVVSRIPYARGLGSSSAAIVAGIVAGLVLAGHRLPCWGSEALLQVAAGIEVGLELGGFDPPRFYMVHPPLTIFRSFVPSIYFGSTTQSFSRDIPITWLPPFTEASNLVFSMELDG